jgi:hypothetical protein
MLAAYHGHAPLVKLLIQHGADPNSLNDRGQSPLAGAVFKGEADVIEVCVSQWLLGLAEERLMKGIGLARGWSGSGLWDSECLGGDDLVQARGEVEREV